MGTAAACDTETTMGVSPETVTVRFAVRVVNKVLAVYVAVIVPLPVPAAVGTHHDWSLVQVQAEFEVTVKGVVPATAVTDCVDGVTESVGAAWETVTVTGVTPVTVVVIVAEREEAVVFCV